MTHCVIALAGVMSITGAVVSLEVSPGAVVSLEARAGRLFRMDVSNSLVSLRCSEVMSSMAIVPS